MGITLRKTSVACGTIFASAALALSTATAGHAANQALIIGGISTPSMSDVIMAPLLGGTFKNQQRVSINWPAQAGPMTGKNHLTLGQSINVGKTNLSTQINASLGQLKAGEKVTVVGLSAGSLVVNEVLRDLAANGNAPGKDKITFVVVADSSRQNIIDDDAKYNKKFDYTYRPAPETKYDVIVITGEYDGMADFPDRWWNALAVTNAIAGALFQHVPVMYADLSKVPAKNIDVDVNSLGGKTTHYLVPADKLPLVRMFPSLAKQEAELKAKIDAAYIRNDVPKVAPKAAPKSLVAAVPVALAAPAVGTATLVAAPASVVVAPVTAATTKASVARVATTEAPVVAASAPAEVPTTAAASLRVAKADDDAKVADAADEAVEDDKAAAEAEADADAAKETEAAEAADDSDASADSTSSNRGDEESAASEDAGSSTESSASSDSGASSGSSE